MPVSANQLWILQMMAGCTNLGTVVTHLYKLNNNITDVVFELNFNL